MKTKIATSIEQSKKLLELGLDADTADMSYLSEKSIVPKVNYNGMVFFNSEEEKPSTIIPCWSLAALLGVLQDFVLTKYVYHKGDDIWVKYMCKNETPELFTAMYDNPVDACVAMIKKLNELNLL